MKPTLLSCLLFVLSSLSLNAQKSTNNAFEKECRLAGGGGIGGGVRNSKTGSDMWVQMNYRLSKLFSVGTEFEYIEFDRPLYSGFQPNSSEKRDIFDNYISFLIKYHLPVKTKLQLNAVCGWTYHIQQETFTYYQTSTSGRYLAEERTHYSNFAIPFIAEIYYPLGNIFQVGVRGKYNLNANNSNDDTYSAGIALAVKL